MNRLLHTSFLVFTMTDHFLEVRVERRRRAAILLLPKTDDPPPSLNPHKINSIPSLRGGTTKQSVDLQSNMQGTYYGNI